jgi:hypothetical protein
MWKNIFNPTQPVTIVTRNMYDGGHEIGTPKSAIQHDGVLEIALWSLSISAPWIVRPGSPGSVKEPRTGKPGRNVFAARKLRMTDKKERPRGC